MKTTTTTTQNTAAIAPGKRVRIGTMAALVTAHTIRRDGAGKLYVAAIEITWWNGSERYCFDVNPCEVTPAEAEDTTRIGF